ncbi:MAG: APC family permease [Acidobacteriaceae bacterium]|nr:APC family permease [Acidobacteriaceae bacterium]
MSATSTGIPGEASLSHGLRKELGLRDLVFTQILCVVGSSWVGVAAKLGQAHLVFWLAGIVFFYLPLAAVVIHLNKLLPLEGGLYQWAKAAFGPFVGFMTAWNLWMYALICVPTILFVIPTDLSYILGRGAEWIPSNRLATFCLTGLVMVAIAAVAIRGLKVAKWLHTGGSAMIVTAYLILLGLPLALKVAGKHVDYTSFPLQAPRLSWLSVAVFGQMTVGGLSGFEYVAIMAGECRSAAKTIGQSVVLSAPIIACMFILGTSSVLAFVGSRPINLIGPIPQTFRLAFGETGPGASIAPFAIVLLLGRAVAAASLIFTGLTRLPMTAGWDHLLPSWFTVLHPRSKAPVNSILFVGTVIMLLIISSMLGVHEQEAMQLLQNASNAHYGIAYVLLFALPLFATAHFRRMLPRWLQAVALAGFLSSIVAVLIAIYPIVDVESRLSYACKIGAVVAGSNLLAVLIYRRVRTKANLVKVAAGNISA